MRNRVSPDKLGVAYEERSRTLLELTARTIADACRQCDLSEVDVVVCGGGVHNTFLMERLTELSQNASVISSATLGVDPDWIEATAFAWLAQQTLHQTPLDLTAVTGANQSTILGGIYYG